VNVTASDPDGNSIASLTADLSGLPAGNNARFTAGTGNTSGTFTWTPSYTSAGTYTVTFRASNALTGTTSTRITVNNVDRAPVVSAPNNVHVRNGNTATVSVTASDPDGQAITTLTADLSQLPSGSGATFTVNASHTSGTLTWATHTGDNGTYAVRFTASNVLSGSATTDIQVRKRAVDAAAQLGATLALSAATPNPASGEVALALVLPEDAPVEWSVFDLQGRAVWHESLALEAGSHTLRWGGTVARGGRAGTGLYLARVRVGSTEFVRRIVRL
jgi:hypothetical protein